MQVQITGRNIDITEPLQAYVKQKFLRLKRHFDHINHAHFILSIETKIHHRAKADMTLTGIEIVAQSDAKDMYQAIDLLMDKLDRQVIKHKENITHH